jgi:hypothetical protein
MDTNNIIIDFANTYKNFKTKDLSEYLSDKIDVSQKMLSWHLRKLVDQEKIFRIGKGVYTIKPKAFFHPIPNALSIRLYKKLKAAYPLLDFCIYNGEILSDLQHHLSYNNNIYIETEREATETIFHFVQDIHKHCFLSPKEDIMSDYVHLDKKAFIVKPLISESPIQEVNDIKVPRIEKLLVDIQCDRDFYYLQGQETLYMMQHAFTNYNVNVGLLLRYASRRNIRSKIEKYIQEII